MLKLRSKIIVLLLIPVLCLQCGIFQKDGSEPISIRRFEVDFFATDTLAFSESIDKLALSYPNFFPVFIEGVLNIASDSRDVEGYLPLLYRFRTHPSMLGLSDSIQKHYPVIDEFELAFGSAFQQYHKYYPDSEIPEVVTFVSEFGNKAILYNHGLGISLDMFLGQQYPYYEGIGLPGFMIAHLNREQILPNAMRILAEDHCTEPGPAATMLDIIINEGKKLYFAQQMLKKTPPYQIIEFSEEQYNWCVENEVGIWSHLIESDILFSQKYGEYNRYVDPSPTTYGMPAESPGRAAVWTGWQIVNAYMDRKSGTSLEKLMREPDSRKILNESKYRPR